MQDFCLVCSLIINKHLEEFLAHSRYSWATVGVKWINEQNQEAHLALDLDCPPQLGQELGPACISKVVCKNKGETGSHSAWGCIPTKAILLPGLAIWPSGSATPPADAGFLVPSPLAKSPMEAAGHLPPWGVLRSFEDTEVKITKDAMEMTWSPC